MSDAIVSRVRRLCYQIYWWLQKMIAPNLRDSQYAYKEALETYVPMGGRWLELGCGHQILPSWIRTRRQVESTLVNRTRITAGMDPVFDQVRTHPTIPHRLVGTVEHCPFRSNSFDLCSCNMVMEHVKDPVAALSETYRILDEGGILLFHTPNFWNYQSFLASLMPQFIKNRLVWLLEGRGSNDIFPAAYKINTATQIEQIAARCGFRVIEIRMVNSTAVAAMLFPIAILELILIRLLETRVLQSYRTNIIAVLRKQERP